MKVVGFERLVSTLDEELGSTWVIPSRHSAEDLVEYKDLINKAEFSPPLFEDGETPEDQIRRKIAPRKKASYDDDDDDDLDDLIDDGDDILFPKNLPNKRLVGPYNDKPGKKRRVRRRKDTSGSELEDVDTRDEIRAKKAHNRRKRELEKQRKIKSNLYVNPSDDESDAERDAEFFAREEAIRQRVKEALKFAPTDITQLQESEAQPAAIEETLKRLMAGSDDEESDANTWSASQRSETKTGSRKRKSDAILADDDGEEEESSPPPAKKLAAQPKKKSRFGFLYSSDEEEDDDAAAAAAADPDSDDEKMETDDTPMSSNPKDAGKDEGARSPLKEKPVSTTGTQNNSDNEGDDDDAVLLSKRRPRVRAAFVMDDSDDE